MSNSALPRGKTLGSRSSLADAKEGERKNFSQKNPRNSLISLVSRERIQGNPRKSNTRNPGFSQRNGNEPRKTKPDRPTATAASEAPTAPSHTQRSRPMKLVPFAAPAA